MIGALRGTPLWDSGTEVCVEVGGVGYVVRVGGNARRLLDENDGAGDVLVYVHHHIREDSQTLYGFATHEERSVFGWLIGLQGVGPALAFSVLGALTPEQLSAVVANDDADLLCSVPGVGRKTAQRIIAEMRDKSDIFAKLDISLSGGGTPASGGGDPVRSEVVEALGELGYSKTEAVDMLREAPPFVHVDDGLRWALRHGKRP